MTVKGDLKLEIDEQGIEVRITITPDESGAELTPESVNAMLAEKKVRSGIDAEAMDKAFRTLLRKKTDPVTFIAASGAPPQPGQPESILFEAHPVPERMNDLAAALLAAAPAPQGFRMREDRIRHEKKVLKKAVLPFLPPRQEIEVVFEKKMVREPVEIDPTVTDIGFVNAGDLVARIKPGTQGKEGKSVFGRLIPAARPQQDGFLFLEGLTRSGAEVKAATAGFLRRGATWCGIVSFQDHALTVSASPDGLTCLLSFVPGDAAAPAPDAREVLSRAGALGFAAASLLPAEDIDAILKEAIARSRAIDAVPLTPIVNGVALVTVSPDKLTAVLYLRKARGGGKPLTTAATSEAIRASRVRGFNAQKVKADLLAFFSGKAAELADYVLVSGRAPKQGAEQKIEWRALFLPAPEADAIMAAAHANAEGLKGLASLAVFPLSGVEAVARVKPDAEVVKITTPSGGEPGVDVFGAALPPGRGGGAAIQLFEGLVMRKDTVVTTAAGILEKGSNGAVTLLRVRPHKDAEMRVLLSPDRMKATISFSPPEGDGKRISAEDARELIRQAGVQRGINQERLAAALGSVMRAEPLTDFLIAEGRSAQLDSRNRIVFHAHLATGSTSAQRRDGSVDFRSQDRITRVQKGEIIATVKPREADAEDGWDVTGETITLAAGNQEALQAGKGVSEALLQDGSITFTAQTQGELVRDGIILSVMDAHSVAGDVNLSTGNINFPGTVRVAGSVRSGFTVVADGVLEIGGSVEAALLSAGGSIIVGQGIKGEGRAIIRTKKELVSAFAEQSVLLAIGDVHLRGSCVRCQVKCNGRLILDSEKGTLVGGEVRASRGIEVQNIGSPGGAHTVVSFGQDFLVKDQIEREEREVAALTKKVADLDSEMLILEKRTAGLSAAGVAAQSRDAAALARARAQKLQAMKLIEQRKLRLITLRDKYDEHVPSEVVIRGTLYPGAILESHGRRFQTPLEKKMITLRFDPAQGKIVEKT
jgi:uncharacterized protein (DUF342 family)